MNKYLVKIAGIRSALSSAADFGERLLGRRAAVLRHEADVLARNAGLGRSPADLQALAEQEAKATRNARIQAGLGAAGLGGAGFLGIHKYHQYKDNAIMDRLNRMHEDAYQAQQY